MGSAFFLKTQRIGFSEWTKDDIALAESLWGNPEVTKYICADGIYSKDDVRNRLYAEIAGRSSFQVQYWPLFTLKTGSFIGCCGLRPHGEAVYEPGFHILPEFWGQGYAAESAGAVIKYAFTVLKAKKLFAGHHPYNSRSQKLLLKLGFTYVGDKFYGPTGLYHPSYELYAPVTPP